MTYQSRRHFVGQISLALAAIGCRAQITSDKDRALPPTPAQLATIEALATRFMGKYNVPGMSHSVAVLGQLVYERAFGVADKSAHEQLTPSHLFRIASVSKPITSVAIFQMIELGLLKTSDLIFGPAGIFKEDFGETAKHPYLEELRLEHLLTHTGGGWQNDDKDPMFANPQMNHKELISWTIANQPLTNRPGTHFAYSNFGYCLVGRVIEKLSQKSYADHVKSEVLSRCGVTDMRISGNTLSDRAPREVVYYGQSENPYDMNVSRMDSHGGWLATASDLVRFATHVDGFATTPNILRPETIAAMTTATDAEKGYAHGWAVNRVGNWWHSGSLPGTTSIMVRTKSGLCWAALTNTRSLGSAMNGDLDRMMWEIVQSVPDWRA
jgi:CubicO group peptidase (beta-lactamase class C family)